MNLQAGEEAGRVFCSFLPQQPFLNGDLLPIDPSNGDLQPLNFLEKELPQES